MNCVSGQGGYFRVTTAGNMAKEKISSPTLTMEHSGYIYMFLYNTSNSSNWVYFDDLKVTHQRSPIVAGADFYPFGLPMEGREITQEGYRWGYQGQYAEKDTVTGWNQFQLRMYDARFGRWLSVDPYGQYASPYLAMGNVPNMFGDSDGGWSLPMAGVGFAVGAGIGYAAGGDLKSALIGGAVGGLVLGASFDNVRGKVSKFNGGFRETGAISGFKPSDLLASTAKFLGENPGLLTGTLRSVTGYYFRVEAFDPWEPDNYVIPTKYPNNGSFDSETILPDEGLEFYTSLDGWTQKIVDSFNDRWFSNPEWSIDFDIKNKKITGHINKTRFSIKIDVHKTGVMIQTEIRNTDSPWNFYLRREVPQAVRIQASLDPNFNPKKDAIIGALSSKQSRVSQKTFLRNGIPGPTKKGTLSTYK